MEKYHERLLKSVENIERLVTTVALRQRDCPANCQVAELPPPAIEQAQALPETYNRVGAALFLLRSERTVTRMRIDGRLKADKKPNGEWEYLLPDLEACFIKIWGFPKPRKKDL